ncbi:MAG: zinc ribbon domain-containing protein [Acidobacteria bacterium]|nr:zinc ribbon domain-containing protein [Acidobacteriota bacterium]
MPLYEYECEACGRRFELIQRFSDPPQEICLSCGRGPVRKLVSSPAIQFKGTGWYVTDYAAKDKARARDGAEAGKEAREGKEATAAKEAKPEAAAGEAAKGPSSAENSTARSSSSSAESSKSRSSKE